MKLLLHIGLPKAASSTLQRDVFCHQKLGFDILETQLDSNFPLKTVEDVIFGNDFTIDLSKIKQDLNEYIEKYKRRYDRFIEILKKKNRIFLIRKDYNKIPSTDITKFFKKINKINPNNKIVLVLLCDYIKPDYLKLRNLLYINYKKLKKFESNDWKGDNYNWDYIVELLNNIFN